MSEQQTYQIRMLINLREQLDFQIGKHVEKVADGTFSAEKCIMALNRILFGHSIVQDALEE